MFLNETGFFGTVVIGLNGITGSLFLSLMLIFIILLVFALALRIPIEATGIILLPLLLTLTAYVPDFLSLLGVALIYLGVVLGKHFLIR